MYLQKNIIPKDTCTPVFISNTIYNGKTRKQSKYPATNEWIKMWTTIDYYSAIKKEQNNAICSNMEALEIITLSEKARERQISYDILYTCYIYIYIYTHTNELIYRTETDPQT